MKQMDLLYENFHLIRFILLCMKGGDASTAIFLHYILTAGMSFCKMRVVTHSIAFFGGF